MPRPAPRINAARSEASTRGGSEERRSTAPAGSNAPTARGSAHTLGPELGIVGVERDERLRRLEPPGPAARGGPGAAAGSRPPSHPRPACRPSGGARSGAPPPPRRRSARRPGPRPGPAAPPRRHVVATHQPVEEQGRPGQLGSGSGASARRRTRRGNTPAPQATMASTRASSRRSTAARPRQAPGPGPADEPHGPEVLEEVPRPLEDELLLADRVAEHRRSSAVVWGNSGAGRAGGDAASWSLAAAGPVASARRASRLGRSPGGSSSGSTVHLRQLLGRGQGHRGSSTPRCSSSSRGSPCRAGTTACPFGPPGGPVRAPRMRTGP